MKEYKYLCEDFNGTSITPCKNFPNRVIAGQSCYQCKFFESHNSLNRTVRCKYDESVNGCIERAINRNVEHPAHYNNYDVEVLEMMRRIWGNEEVKSFCKLNAFKYRMRAGHKDNLEQDLEKEEFYLNYMNNL